MSDYTQIVDYSAKDALASGDAAKKILGSEIDAELGAISTAIASKLDSSGGPDLAVADGGTGASTAAGARTNLGAAGLGDSNAFTGVNTFSTTAAATAPVTITSTEAGATAGPYFDLYRNSASPAASDVIGQMNFYGEDSAGNQENYAAIRGGIDNPTSTSEDGYLALYVTRAGTIADRLTLRAGVTVGSAAGGDQGAATLNAHGLYVDSVAVGSLVWSNFTPTVTLVGGAGNTTPVYSTNSGRYIQIGNKVHGEVYLTGDGGVAGAGTGVVNIALPVQASASNLTGYVPVGVGLNNTTYMLLVGQTGPNATTIALAYFDTIGTLSPVTGAQQNNATRTLRIAFTYEV